jgi:hypothetical protein
VVIDYLDATQVPYRLERRGESTEITVGASPQLPEPLREGTACLVGNTVPGSPFTSLHLGHPLVQAALEQARDATRNRTFKLRIAAQAPDVQQLKGHRGRLRLVRIRYRGFEPVDRLLPVVVLDGFDEPLSVDVAQQLLDGTITDLAAPSTPPSSTDVALDDALDELLFRQTGEAGALEQPRFDRTLEQIERFVTDRVLLLSQQRDLALVRLAKAEATRDAAVGAEQRDRTEAALRRVQSELDRLDGEISRLRAGDDENYERWRKNTHERRYAAPEIERLIDAEIEIA